MESEKTPSGLHAEQRPMVDSGEVVGSGPMTTREAAVAAVAGRWLAAHPGVRVTGGDLSKTIQQLLTEVFMTGRQRRGVALSAHASALLATAGLEPGEFAGARVFSRFADMPASCGRAFARLAVLLAPLAAAVQLARIPVTDAAARLIDQESLQISRPDLRGFVAGRVRRVAQDVHARAGFDLPAEGYLSLILSERDALAADVASSAKAKRSRCTRLSPRACGALEAYVRIHGPRLRAAARRHGQDAEDVYADATLKLAVAFRNKPDLDAGAPFGVRAVDNVAIDRSQRRITRWGQERPATDELELYGGAVDSDVEMVGVADAVLRHVLDCAESLRRAPDEEAAVARQVLLRYFLVEPQVLDPRRARLAPHVLDLTGGSDDEVALGLAMVAAVVAPGPAVAARATKLAIDELRRGASQSPRRDCSNPSEAQTAVRRRR